MQKTTIRERDIQEVIISDGGASVYYSKEKKSDMYYAMRYKYNTTDGETYCPYCGAQYKIGDGDENHCPICDGKNREILDISQLPELVYAMLQDDCEVTITLWSGKSEKFVL